MTMSDHTRRMWKDSAFANDNARTLAEVEQEADELWSEIEPMLRTHNALLKRVIELREMGDE